MEFIQKLIFKNPQWVMCKLADIDYNKHKGSKKTFREVIIQEIEETENKDRKYLLFSFLYELHKECLDSLKFD